MMWPYFVMVGVPAVLSVGNAFLRSRKLNKAVITSFFAIWFLILIFRSFSVGADVNHYKLMFRQISQMSFGEIFNDIFSTNYEAGYFLLSKFVSFFTDDFRVMLVIIALISLIPLWLLYRDYAEKYSYLSIAIFLCVGLFSMVFSGFRQVMAISLAVPAFYFTKQKKWPLFLLMVFLAVMCHHSAFIILAMYPVYHLKLKRRRNILIVLPILAVFYIFRVQIFSFLSRFIAGSYTSDMTQTGAIAIFLLLIVFVIYSYMIPDPDQLDSETVGLRNLLILCTVLQSFAGVHSLAMRMNYYFILFVPLLIPRVANRTSYKMLIVTFFSLLTMYAFFTFYYFYNAYTGADYLMVYPYYPFWS